MEPAANITKAVTTTTAISSQQSTVSNQQSAISSQQSTVSNQQSAISSQQSTVSNQQSAISNQQSTVSNQQSAISNQQSAIGNQQSAISKQQSAISSQQSAIRSQTQDSSPNPNNQSGAKLQRQRQLKTPAAARREPNHAARWKRPAPTCRQERRPTSER